MNELKFENAIELLLNKFPEFKLSTEYKESDQDVTYLVYAAFCQYLAKLVNNGLKEDVIGSVFSFTNEMIEKGDKEMKTLAFTGIIENIADSKILVNHAKKYLNPKGREVLSELTKNL